MSIRVRARSAGDRRPPARSASLLLAATLSASCLVTGCSEAVLVKGRESIVTEGRTYRLEGLEVAIIRIVVAMERDAEGRDHEVLRLRLRVGNEELWLSEDRPTVVGGLVFTVSGAGHRWGATPATATLGIAGR